MARGLYEFWKYMDEYPNATTIEAIKESGIYKLAKPYGFEIDPNVSASQTRQQVEFYLKR